MPQTSIASAFPGQVILAAADSVDVEFDEDAVQPPGGDPPPEDATIQPPGETPFQEITPADTLASPADTLASPADTLASPDDTLASPPVSSAFTVPDSLAGLPPADRLYLARVHAGADERVQAIAFYESVFSDAPGLALQYGHELGYQLLWADRPREAIPWFERRLDGEPGNVEARLGYARALTWADRNYEGWQEYRRVLVGHPDTMEARLGEARALAWMGRHREAIRQYESILDDDPNNVDARLGMAQAWAWEGDSTRALAALGPLGNDPRAQSMRAQIIDDNRPRIVADTHLTDDSNELGIWTNRLMFEAQTRTFQDIRAAAVRRRFRQIDQPDIDSWAFTGGGGVRLGGKTQLHAYLTPYSFASDAAINNGGSSQALDFTFVGWDAWFTWWPSRRTRFDLATDRTFIDTPISLSYEIEVTSGTASFDWRFAPNFEASAMVRVSDYSDGNRRDLAKAMVTWRKGARWRWHVRPTTTIFQFAEQVERGYWNPEKFINLIVYGGVEGDISHKLNLMAEAGLGYEKADDPDVDFDSYEVVSLGTRLTWRFSRRVRAELGGGFSNSRMTNPGGYQRSWIMGGMIVDF